MRRISGTIIILFIFITSCATTTLLSTWRDDGYGGPVKKVLIMGVAEKPSMRKVFEQEFVNQLKERGVEAVASYWTIPSDKMMDKNTVQLKIQDLNVDSILITQLVETKTVTSYYSDWYDHYTQSYGRRFVDQVVNLETSLYEAETGKLVWSALSETVIMEEDSRYRKVKSFIKTMVNNMSKEKLI